MSRRVNNLRGQDINGDQAASSTQFVERITTQVAGNDWAASWLLRRCSGGPGLVPTFRLIYVRRQLHQYGRCGELKCRIWGKILTGQGRSKSVETLQFMSHATCTPLASSSEISWLVCDTPITCIAFYISATNQQTLIWDTSIGIWKEVVSKLWNTVNITYDITDPVREIAESLEPQIGLDPARRLFSCREGLICA